MTDASTVLIRPLRDRLADILAAPLGLPADVAELLAQVERLPPLSEQAPIAAAQTALSHLAASGLLRYAVPQQGNEQAFVPRLCVLRAALGYLSPLYDLMFAMQGLGSYGAIRSGAAPSGFVDGVVSGQTICGIGLTEPGAGSDVSQIATRAVRSDDGSYVIDGDKVFISNAGVATHLVLYARTDAHPKKGLTAFLLPMDTAGVTVEPMQLLCDDHVIGRVLLRSVRLPDSARLGTEGQGMTLAMQTLEVFRPTVGAAAVGMARRAFDEAIDHSQRRKQFGQALASLQATQLALAEMATDCEAAALLVQRAAQLACDGQSLGSRSSMAKLFATEAAQRVVDRAVQLGGGQALVRGHVLERLYRDVRALRIYEGTSEIQKLIISRHLLR
jgi:acyl-CoA dehydrogenase